MANDKNLSLTIPTFFRLLLIFLTFKFIKYFCEPSLARPLKSGAALKHGIRNPETETESRKRKRNTESNTNDRKLKNFTLHNLVQSKDNLS